MHALIVVAHPEANSLSHAVAAHLGEGVSMSDPNHVVEIADLAAEAFDPRFTKADLAVHRRQAPAPADVTAEQARIDRSDALVLVYPVYWWSMPALLKGWIDRVFSNGWAYDDSTGKVTKKLDRLRVHLVGIGGADERTFVRHGYFDAMKTQIDHGIFDYCGALVVTSEFLLESDTRDQAVGLETARAIGRNLFAPSGSGDMAKVA